MSLMKRMAEKINQELKKEDDYLFYVAFPKGFDKKINVNDWVDMVKEYNMGKNPKELNGFDDEDRETLEENLELSTEEGEWFFAVVMKKPIKGEYMVSYVDWNHLDQKNDYDFNNSVPLLKSCGWLEVSRDDFNKLSGKNDYAKYLIEDMLQYME